MDACFWTDIFIHFNTAIVITDPYTCKMELVLSRREIARQYLRLWFWLDVFGSLPVQAIEDALSSGTCSLSSIKALRFNRLVMAEPDELMSPNHNLRLDLLVWPSWFDC